MTTNDLDEKKKIEFDNHYSLSFKPKNNNDFFKQFFVFSINLKYADYTMCSRNLNYDTLINILTCTNFDEVSDIEINYSLENLINYLCEETKFTKKDNVKEILKPDPFWFHLCWVFYNNNWKMFRLHTSQAENYYTIDTKGINGFLKNQIPENLKSKFITVLENEFCFLLLFCNKYNFFGKLSFTNNINETYIIEKLDKSISSIHQTIIYSFEKEYKNIQSKKK